MGFTLDRVDIEDLNLLYLIQGPIMEQDEHKFQANLSFKFEKTMIKY